MADDRCDLLCLDLPRAEDIRRQLDDAAIADAAARGKALGDPTRVDDRRGVTRRRGAVRL